MKYILLFSFLCFPVIMAYSQDNLFDLLEDSNEDSLHITSATFKATRILNGHSIERMPAKQLDFRIHHRFGRINSGAYEFWGLDQANIHLGLEYGINDWLMAGIGRGSYEKTFDGFLKFSLLRQTSGAKTIPFSVTYLLASDIKSIKWTNTEREYPKYSRLSYIHQLLIARKFNDNLSLQFSTSLIHRNLVATELDPNDKIALGIGGRIKITKRISFNSEYFYVFNPESDYQSSPLYNPFSFGFDIETGGHVFQLIFTNSLAMTEKGFITETTGQWKEGDIHFGFNISRVFAF